MFRTRRDSVAKNEARLLLDSRSVRQCDICPFNGIQNGNGFHRPVKVNHGFPTLFLFVAALLESHESHGVITATMFSPVESNCGSHSGADQDHCRHEVPNKLCGDSNFFTECEAALCFQDVWSAFRILLPSVLSR